jgi:hypothetical protein
MVGIKCCNPTVPLSLLSCFGSSAWTLDILFISDGEAIATFKAQLYHCHPEFRMWLEPLEHRLATLRIDQKTQIAPTNKSAMDLSTIINTSEERPQVKDEASNKFAMDLSIIVNKSAQIKNEAIDLAAAFQGTAMQTVPEVVRLPPMRLCPPDISPVATEEDIWFQEHLQRYNCRSTCLESQGADAMELETLDRQWKLCIADRILAVQDSLYQGHPQEQSPNDAENLQRIVEIEQQGQPRQDEVCFSVNRTQEPSTISVGERRLPRLSSLDIALQFCSDQTIGPEEVNQFETKARKLFIS